MKPIKSITKSILLLIVVGALSACGGNDLGNFYTASMTLSDGTSDDTVGIDINQNICTAATATTPATYEDFYPSLAHITVTVEDGMPGLTLNSYTIDYQEELSPDSTGNSVMPPSLQDLTDAGSNTVHCPTGSSTSFTITCISLDTKEEYAAQERGVCNALEACTWGILSARYTMRITLHFTDDSGADRDIEVRRTVYFYDVDNC
jgi:hypothetical protein